MLMVTGVNTFYGSIQALTDVTLEVNEGEVVSLIGSNGAGKSTLLRTICGLTPPVSGEVQFLGEPISRLHPTKVVRRGISLVPEGRRIFPELTVQDNLELGAFVRRKNKAEVAGSFEEVYHLFPVLRERRLQLGGTLSGGQQQMLAIGRALMARPRLLLLDEPSLGLAPIVVEELFATVRRINEQRKLTVLLAEQNARMALGIAARGYVMVTGKVVLADRAANLRENDMVRSTYLGG